MSFRVVWYGRFGEESSQLIDELDRARLIADFLAPRMNKTIHVVDTKSHNTVYSASPTEEARPSKPRRAPRRRHPASSR